MVEHKYRVTYDVTPHPEGLTKDELTPGRGACDGLVLASILGHPGGPGDLSVAFVSLDGFTGLELTPEQQFLIWAMWAHALAEKLSGSQRDLCQLVHDTIKTARRSGDDPPVA